MDTLNLKVTGTVRNYFPVCWRFLFSDGTCEWDEMMGKMSRLCEKRQKFRDKKGSDDFVRANIDACTQLTWRLWRWYCKTQYEFAHEYIKSAANIGQFRKIPQKMIHVWGWCVSDVAAGACAISRTMLQQQEILYEMFLLCSMNHIPHWIITGWRPQIWQAENPFSFIALFGL